ncbi:MAG: phosphate signaling complex protein PhoU [Erysipelothrix sp.]|nr:phosphate signaling complex protein PhoU [Erysipelothrix sp.]
MKTVLDTQLIVLKNEIAKMGLLCEEALVKSMQALRTHDLKLAQEIIDYDKHINNMEKEIQSLCYSLLIRQQPVASDFRFLSASLKIVTDLERIADYATDISEIIMEYPDTHFLFEKDLILMSKEVIIMLNNSIESLMSMDINLAQMVIKHDDKVDDGLKNLKHVILDDMMSTNKGKESILDTFMIAKYFERCGDRCVNIAESVIFFATGN